MKACCDAFPGQCPKNGPSAQAKLRRGRHNKACLLVAMVGNPNGGKTTLFNALTGANQHIGNRPGVTVECKSGYFTDGGVVVEVMDLPGIYSLDVSSATAAIDERITAEFLARPPQKIDLVINIVDASQLERHLYLSTQLLSKGMPVILALNMMDVARTQKIEIDTDKLSRELGCPVVKLEANKGAGVIELKQAMLSYQGPATAATIEPLAIPAPEAVQTPAEEGADVFAASARYRYIEGLLQRCVRDMATAKPSMTARIDAIVLNRVLGLPIFFAMMYLLFVFAINIGGVFQDFFDISSQTIFVDGFAYGLTQLDVPSWLKALLANGVGKGINTTVTFVPVIGCMFLFLALLEDSGYMARAAFIIDRLMRALGLPGKAFVPMIVGFGCNVPAVMGARTLENRRDRILTIMMTPFMSCGARLTIFTVFTAAFFPKGGQNIVFALYLIGIMMAVFTGYLLRRTLLPGDPSPLVMELPRYHVPHGATVLLHTWHRLKGFVFRAGKLIVPICVLIGALNALNLDGTLNTGEGSAHSLLSQLGRLATPLFAPLGIQPDNWPATVGLVTGILAKEVVVGTLNTLYSQASHVVATVSSMGSFDLWGGLWQAVLSVPENLRHLNQMFSNPLQAQASGGALNQSVYGLMYHQFDGKVGAFAYLLFVLLYFPCISTMAVMTRELHRGWSIFSAIWMTGTAYGTAVVFYQAATLFRHPLSSILWISALLGAFFATIAAVQQRVGSKKACSKKAVYYS